MHFSNISHNELECFLGMSPCCGTEWLVSGLSCMRWYNVPSRTPTTHYASAFHCETSLKRENGSQRIEGETNEWDRTTVRVGNTELENQSGLLTTAITTTKMSNSSCYGFLPFEAYVEAWLAFWRGGDLVVVRTSRVSKTSLRAGWLSYGKAIPHVLTAPATSTPLPFCLLPWGETTRGLCWKSTLQSYLLSTNEIMGTTPLMTSCNVNYLSWAHFPIPLTW